MNIEIRCNGCDKNLQVLGKTIVPGMDTLRLAVESCGEVDCNNCEGCEDAALLQAAREKNVRLTNELKNIKEHMQ